MRALARTHTRAPALSYSRTHTLRCAVTHTHSRTRVCTHLHPHTCTYVHLHICTHTYTHSHMHTFSSKHMHTCAHTHMQYTHADMHTLTRTCTPPTHTHNLTQHSHTRTHTRTRTCAGSHTRTHPGAWPLLRGPLLRKAPGTSPALPPPSAPHLGHVCATRPHCPLPNGVSVPHIGLRAPRQRPCSAAPEREPDKSLVGEAAAEAGRTPPGCTA